MSRRRSFRSDRRELPSRALSDRAAKGLVHLALEAGDGALWCRPSPEFALAMVAALVMPVPLFLGRRALDRLRLQG